MEANGKEIEKKRKILNLSRETLISKIQTEHGLDLTYRGYVRIISKGLLPIRNGNDLVVALSEILDCSTDEITTEISKAA